MAGTEQGSINPRRPQSDLSRTLARGELTRQHPWLEISQMPGAQLDQRPSCSISPDHHRHMRRLGRSLRLSHSPAAMSPGRTRKPFKPTALTITSARRLRKNGRACPAPRVAREPVPLTSRTGTYRAILINHLSRTSAFAPHPAVVPSKRSKAGELRAQPRLHALPGRT
jgi:hypothetical protein